MSKQGVYTTAGVALAIMIGFCGWLLTNSLLDRQEALMLATTGSIRIAPLAYSSSNPNVETAPITAEMMAQILQNWNEPGSLMRLHEPVEGQLGMEQAIAAAETGLSYFSTHGIIPPELLENEFTRITASLCENQPAVKADPQKYVIVTKQLHPEYSYWRIFFFNEKVSAQLTLNAVTGKIWRADIFSYQAGTTVFNDLNVLEMMKNYAAYLELDGGDYGDSLDFNETWASEGFAGDRISVTAQKNETGTGSNKSYNGISLYLSEFGRPVKFRDITVAIAE